MSLAWTGLIPSRPPTPIFGLDSATNFQEFREAARSFAVPSQNLLYADREGHIGYQAPGQVPIRRSDTPGRGAGLLAGAGLALELGLEGLRRRSSEMP